MSQMSLKARLLSFGTVIAIGASVLVPSPAHAGSLCADGWVSPSTGSGTCSWHGGIASGLSYWYPSKPKTVKAVKFKTCGALRKQYPAGLAESSSAISTAGFTFKRAYKWSAAYKLNKSLDKDKNGLACEVLVPYGTRYRPAQLQVPMRLNSLTVQPLSFQDDYTPELCKSKEVVPGCKYQYEGMKNINGVPDLTYPERWARVEIAVRNDGSDREYLDGWKQYAWLTWGEGDKDRTIAFYPLGYLDKSQWATAVLQPGESKIVSAYFSLSRKIPGDQLMLKFYNAIKDAYLDEYWRDADLYYKLNS